MDLKSFVFETLASPEFYNPAAILISIAALGVSIWTRWSTRHDAIRDASPIFRTNWGQEDGKLCCLINIVNRSNEDLQIEEIAGKVPICEKVMPANPWEDISESTAFPFSNKLELKRCIYRHESTILRIYFQREPSLRLLKITFSSSNSTFRRKTEILTST